MPTSPPTKCRTPECPHLVYGGYCDQCRNSSKAESKVTIIAGAPCSGKTTYVHEHAKAGDLILDLDAIHEALGSPNDHNHPKQLLPFALAARDAIIERLGEPHDVPNTWLIVTGDTIQKRHIVPNAEVIVIYPTMRECLERATQRPHWTNQVIEQWYANYEPHSKDVVICP
jgi:hypothetical protein